MLSVCLRGTVADDTAGSGGSEEWRSLKQILPLDFSDPTDTLERVREKFAEVHGHDPGDDVVLEQTPTGIWVRSREGAESDAVIFFVHGGGFVTSDAASYAFYAANLVRATGSDVFVAEYRLAPETRFPAQLHDLVTAYDQVRADHAPGQIVFAGDSCGGGMAIAALVLADELTVPLPAGAVSLCGWFDLTASGGSHVDREEPDPFLDSAWLRLRALDYVGPDRDIEEPLASPVEADLSGLPPLLLQAGGLDPCRSEAEEMTVNADRDGVAATLSVWPAMPQGFQGLVGAIPEADDALAEIADFVAKVTSQG